MSAIDDVVAHVPSSERYDLAAQIVAEARRRARLAERRPQVKRCPSCDEVKDTALFGPHAGRPDGLQSMCRACRSRPRESDPHRHR